MTEPAVLPAVRERNHRLDDLARLGQWLSWAESGATDERSLGAAAALRLYYATELGLTPMAAAELSLIKGRLVVGAGLLRALARRAGYRVIRTHSDHQVCIARISDARTGELLGESEFTLDDAKQAGLIRAGSAWTTHPKRMLWARASKNVINDFAPEVALGMILDDEAAEFVARPGDPSTFLHLPAVGPDGGDAPATDVPWQEDTPAAAERTAWMRERDSTPSEPRVQADAPDDIGYQDDDEPGADDGVDVEDIEF
jgi:hypothetical protein